MFGKIKKYFLHFESIDEKNLIKQAKSADGEAFGKLYLQNLDGIYRYIYFRINFIREEAEDLTEVVFFKAWKAIGSLKDNNFRAWIYRIAHNTLVDYYKRERRNLRLENELIDESPGIEQKVGLKLEFEQVMKALDKLTSEQKEVVTLRFVEDLSHKEIAQMLGKEEEAIRAIQHRALKRLKRLLER